MVPAICPTLAKGTLKPKPSVSLTFFGRLGFFPFGNICAAMSCDCLSLTCFECISEISPQYSP
jgi:hypothetical protein